MIIIFTTLPILILIIACTIYLKLKDKNNDFILEGYFANRSGGNSLTEAQKEQIIQQKITHKSIAFFALLFGLAISFLLAIYILIDINNKNFNVAFFTKIVELASGIGSTEGLRRFYIRCSNDVDRLR